MLKLTTPCFVEGGWIPDYNAGFGEDQSPEFHIEGIAYGKHCYRGPKPPFNWNHEYLFTLYTLDCTLEADEKSRKEDILKLAEDHILQKSELRGKYQRKHR